jgi:HD superfamily phosphohydrolase
MIIRDVVHNDIEITEAVIIDLISTSEFQRLRKIKQLGLSYMVFPSTEHSRFTHSIGVYHMTMNFIASLEKNANKKCKQRLKEKIKSLLKWI